MCTFGSAAVKCEWRNTELGILSCLLNKEINMQLENPHAYKDLVNELLTSYEIKPSKKKIKKQYTYEEGLGEKKKIEVTKMEAYTELVELAQRKFLRQITSFSGILLFLFFFSWFNCYFSITYQI